MSVCVTPRLCVLHKLLYCTVYSGVPCARAGAKRPCASCQAPAAPRPARPARRGGAEGGCRLYMLFILGETESLVYTVLYRLYVAV